jgi:hypothetical protein
MNPINPKYAKETKGWNRKCFNCGLLGWEHQWEDDGEGEYMACMNGKIFEPDE